MRVLVCGSRGWKDHDLIYSTLDVLTLDLADDDELTIVHGAAPGADTYAGRWARMRGAIEEPHPANWNKLGKRAGPIRNNEMLASGVDRVIAFRLWGESPGTDHMVTAARKKGVSAFTVNPDGTVVVR